MNNMNMRKHFSRVVLYNGQHNFDRLKRYAKDLGKDFETDPSNLLAGVSDPGKRTLIEQRAQRDRDIIKAANSSSRDAEVAQKKINSSPEELPNAQFLDKSLKELRGKDRELRKLGLSMEDRRVLLDPYYKKAETRQARHNTMLARAVASEFMPQNLKKK